uniref:Uncharacterized protein n=1 Tax=Scytodes thoracica TaxID=1112478 RepID=A0A0A0VA32_SCYTH|nr:hypothetical protein [Scytodes thoracica]
MVNISIEIHTSFCWLMYNFKLLLTCLPSKLL